MNVAIFTDDALNMRHGTGAQVLRTFEGTGVEMVHFYRLDSHGVSDPQHRSVMMKDTGDFFWKPQRGKRILTEAAYALSLRWQNGSGNRINQRKFESSFQKMEFSPDVAYVIVYDERGAASVLPLVKSLKCPYVVHIMDIFEPEGLDPQTMPGMRGLLEGAHSVLCITPTAQDEVRKFAVRGTQQVFIGQVVAAHRAVAPHAGEPLQMVMVGNPYLPGMEVLANSIGVLDAMDRPIEMSYIGAAYDRLPERLRERVKNVGMVSDRETYQKLLAGNHLAYLCGPSAADFVARFSFPSRTSDYLMAGLPVLACVTPDSAAERILSKLVPEAVHLTRSPELVGNAIRYFGGSTEDWERASRIARDFATSEMNITTIRARILEELSLAANDRGAS